MKRRVQVVAALSAVSLALLACSMSTTGSSPPTAGDASATSPSCSEGPPIAQGSPLPNVPRQPDAAPCTPRCGADTSQQTAGFYFLGALPSGACTDEPVCTMSVYDGCGHQGAQCECIDGQWSCGIAMRARVTCPDASSD